MAKPIIIDLRNIYRPDDMAQIGFTYESIGRRSIHQGVVPATLERKYAWIVIKMSSYTEIDPDFVPRDEE